MYKFLLFLSLTFFFVGCESYNDKKDQLLPSVVGDIVDNAAWYSDESGVVTDVNVTIPVPNKLLCAPYTDPTGPLRPCTFDDVYHDTDPWDDYQPELAVKFFTQDFPLANEQTNAVLKQKGKSTRGKEFFIKHAKPKFSRPIFLYLNGLGIRDITYDAQKKVYWIIAGGSTERNFRFELWMWDKKNRKLSYVKNQPDIGYGEGITVIKQKSKNPALFIVEDNEKKPNKTANYVMIEKNSL